ncbi:glycine-rich domain-containing protein, partial [Mangrovicoccus sp. HB161399]|uniref:glycine-rich domain-containing protein n=1 Tax=Mangrovicoccus sp. HB161399 TaxID=2720392 RepID=UPI0015535555
EFSSAVAATAYTAPAGLRALLIEIWGAGGGAGGVDGNNGSGIDDAASGGGGGGGYSRKFHLHVSGQTYTYSVGAGGTSAAGAVNGTDGGASTFASSGTLSMLANGGSGGAGATGTTTGQWNGGSGGTAGGGSLNVRGQSGGMGKVNAGNPVLGAHGGAPGALFPGTMLRFMNQDGWDATSPGAGGAGAVANSVDTNWRGGYGADGLVRIQPFF